MELLVSCAGDFTRTAAELVFEARSIELSISQAEKMCPKVQVEQEATESHAQLSCCQGSGFVLN